ncbi:MAG TPA: S53 family peptidase [Candidatus Angelobacter sp.]|nr:S53 family peptidase [Candidatus Angelobacter sp.]
MSETRRSVRARLAVAGVPLMVGAAAMQLSTAPPARADTLSTSAAGWHQLTRAVIPGLGNATRLQALPTSQKIQVGVALTDPNAAAEQAAAAAVYDPASPAYHQFFTPAQWQASFGLPQATYSGVVSQLTAQGLRVAYASPTRSYVTLGGTVAAVERTFGVDLSTYQAADGQQFFANAQAPSVPDGVDAVLGLESLSVQHPAAPPVDTTAQSGPCVQGTCIGVVTPQDLWSIYGMPASNRGQGQKVAVIGEGDMAGPVADLRTWETRQGLPAVPVREHAVADDQTDKTGLLEWNIDTQATTGMAPDVQELDLYFTQNLGVTAGAFSVWANDTAGPQQANASFGGCESVDLALGSVQAEEPMFQQAAAEGRTLFVSTGDTGGSCTAVTGNGVVNTVVPQVEWPAASRWVVAVGGTELFASSGANPQRVLEKAWEYTGGGMSLTQPEQPWQATAAPLVKAPCLVDDTAFPQTTAPTCRGLPDVAAMSGDTLFNQYDITSAGSNNFGAGTSLSSPLWAGMWTRIQAAAPAAGLGFAAPVLYKQGASATADPRDFFDVSVGSNGQYPALPRSAVDPSGWDFVSGLGVANVSNLMQDVTGQLTPSNTTAPIGGGGSTSLSGECGGANGTLTAPEGNQLFPFAAASVTKVVPSYSSASASVTVTFTVPQMSSGTHNELDFYWLFYDGTTQYELDASYDPVMGNSFLLYNLTASTGVATAIDSTLTGGFDFTAGTATITMTVAQFNNAAKPATPLAAGSVLQNTTASSGYEYTGYGGIISNGQCPFTLA